jgi:hypothetical protein
VRAPAAYGFHSDVDVTPVMYARTTTSTGSVVADRATSTLGSGTDTTWLAITSAVRSNHHAASWLSTWPLYGTPARMRSNADRRSVVTNSR